MPNPEHVCYLVSHYSHRSVLYKVVVDLVSLLLEKSLVVSSKGKDTSPLSNTCESKHKIPFFSGVEVCHADTDKAERIRRQFLF